MYVYIPCTCSTCRGPKMAWTGIGITTVSSHMGVRNRIQILWKSSQCSKLLSHLSSPKRRESYSYNFGIYLKTAKVLYIFITMLLSSR